MPDGIMFDKGVALIVEGNTEKEFYSEFIESRAHVYGASAERAVEGDGTRYVVKRRDGSYVLVKLNNVGAVTQMPNSAIWFKRSCALRYPSIDWLAFLCYDTDGYNEPITKFHEGDWERLRADIEQYATGIVDLAAEADIEDILLCDYEGVLSFLGLPNDTPLPDGKKGKTRMKYLFRRVRPTHAYHTGERARHLIRSLDMCKIMNTAPIPLVELDAAIFS